MQSPWFWASTWAAGRPGCANLGSRVLIDTGPCLAKLLSVAMEHSAVATEVMECFHSSLAMIFIIGLWKFHRGDKAWSIHSSPLWENINSFPALQRCLWHHSPLPSLPHPCPFTHWHPGLLLLLSCMGKVPTSDWSILADLPWVKKPPLSLRKPSPAPFYFFTHFKLCRPLVRGGIPNDVYLKDKSAYQRVGCSLLSS